MADSGRSPEPARHETVWCLWVAVGAMALTMLPYLFGWALVGAGKPRAWFCWLGYNLDDSSVYLAWMRQVADGHFFQRNLFTTDAQVGHQFNLFFQLLGVMAGVTHLPLLLLYHVIRIVLGVAFLRSVWWLLCMLLRGDRARRAAYLLVCFGAGLGWLPGLWRHSGLNSPVDVWQPEAVTFLCLYLAPLFLISLLLMVGVIGWLWHGEETGRWSDAARAGVCGLLLGNIHTYDVITLVAVWGAFLVVRTVADRRFDARSWGRAALAGAMTAVSCGYMYLLMKTEPVFAARVAVETLSPQFRLYVLGYGLLLPLAVWGAWLCLKPSPEHEGGAMSRGTALLLVTWAVANLAAAYLPVPYQRKMLMGVHLPIAMLAGVAVATALGKLRGRAWTAALAGCVVLLGITNVRFLARDAGNFMDNRGQSRIQRPYLYEGEIHALAWIRRNAPADAAVQPIPWIAVAPDGAVGFVDTTVACLAPGLTGHPVNAGHWGETPEFATTMGRWVQFLLPRTSDATRRDLLRESRIRYVIFSQKREETRGGEADALLSASPVPGRVPYLVRIPAASSDDTDVYQVALDRS